MLAVSIFVSGWNCQMILIIDFTCAREESHSWDSLVKFQEEIQGFLRVPTLICIPRSAAFEQKQHNHLKLLDINPFKDLLSGELNSMNFSQFIRATMEVFREIRRLLQNQNIRKLVWVNADASSLLVCYLFYYFIHFICLSYLVYYSLVLLNRQ